MMFDLPPHRISHWQSRSSRVSARANRVLRLGKLNDSFSRSMLVSPACAPGAFA